MRAGVLGTIFAVLHLAGCPMGPPPLQGAGEVGMRRNLVLLEVPIEIEGRELGFIVDTGSSVTSITDQTAAAIGVRRSGRTTVNGRQAAETATITRLSLAGLEVRDVAIAVLSLAVANKLTHGYAGILGLDVLGRYDTVIDLHRSTLTVLHAGTAARQASDALARIPIRTTRDGLVVLDVTLAGRTVPAILDTGSTDSMISPQTLPGRDADIVSDQLSVGSIGFGLATFAVTEHPVFARSGFAGRPAVLLGVDVLDGRQLVLAYQERALYVSREPPLSDRGPSRSPRTN